MIEGSFYPPQETKRFIKDLCDFCKKLAYVHSGDMKKRLKGYKFGCKDCHDKKLFKWSTENKRSHVCVLFDKLPEE